MPVTDTINETVDLSAITPLMEIVDTLERIPEVEFPLQWSERPMAEGFTIEACGETAAALKLVLSKREELTAELRNIAQIRKAFVHMSVAHVKRFFGTVQMVLAHRRRVNDLLEANNRYQEEARVARRELAELRASLSTIDAVIVKFDEALASRFDEILKRPERQPREAWTKAVRSPPPEPKLPSYTSRQLRNIFALMSSIDRHEIQVDGYEMPDGSWAHFQENPAARFLATNDECREAITKALNKRLGA